VVVPSELVWQITFDAMERADGKQSNPPLRRKQGYSARAHLTTRLRSDESIPWSQVRFSVTDASSTAD
ncbi:MAG TPA: hypothetical protein VF772_16085, partial [Terriglobales bacterium]